MYQFLTYPLDVIKTNRILGTPLAKEAGEAIPKEFLTLYELGMFRTGLYRGFAPFFISMPFWKHVHDNKSDGYPIIVIASGTLMLNPLAVM